MDKTGQKLLNLMFRPDETVCVSHNIYAYHSIPLENAENGTVTLVSPNPKVEFEKVDSSRLTLVALNPIKGWRNDENVTAYRNFLVEVDYGPLQGQLEYIKKLEMPYSAVVFSGNKSLHFLISLDRDLPNYNIYYHMAEWILNIATMADPNTKNPSRSIRIPGAYREPDKKQILVEYKGPISQQELAQWLAKHPEARPKISEKREISEDMDFGRVAPWVSKRLMQGVTENRNKMWFAIGFELALSGYSEYDAIEKLGVFFTPDRDFKEREWKTTIKSAFKKVYTRK